MPYETILVSHSLKTVPCVNFVGLIYILSRWCHLSSSVLWHITFWLVFIKCKRRLFLSWKLCFPFLRCLNIYQLKVSRASFRFAFKIYFVFWHMMIGPSLPKAVSGRHLIRRRMAPLRFVLRRVRESTSETEALITLLVLRRQADRNVNSQYLPHKALRL